MSILSRLTKGTKGAEEPKKATTSRTLTKPVPASSKNVPSQTTRTALAIPPPTTTVSAEEIRSRIAAARRMKSNTSLRTAQSPPHPNRNSRPRSEYSVARPSVSRNDSRMSLDGFVAKEAYPRRSEQPVSPMRGRQIGRSDMDSLFGTGGNLPNLDKPRNVPRMPPRPRLHRSVRSMSTTASRMRSPLSAIAVEEEEGT
jgi:hypothetical protein